MGRESWLTSLRLSRLGFSKAVRGGWGGLICVTTACIIQEDEQEKTGFLHPSPFLLTDHSLFLTVPLLSLPLLLQQLVSSQSFHGKPELLPCACTYMVGE